MAKRLKDLLVAERLREVAATLALSKRATAGAPKRALRINVYKARDGWRFRIIAGNGRIVAQGEAYTRLASAKRGAARLMARG